MTEITNYITNDFRPIDSQETIASVQDFFADLNFSHFPVVENEIFIGSIASDDVETFDADKKAIDYKYTLERFFARKSMLWLDVLEVFAKSHTNVIPVLDENNIYIGYYEMEDIMKFFQETPFLKEQGGIIIVQKGLLDYSMGQVTQIVESNNGKILGCFISEADLENVQITIKIGVGPMNEIIQTFRRYNYEIISEHQEDAYINSLKERSDYLDKYLNI
ncbi:CBS domain-containing protein [Flavobacterium hibernum]|uniref:Acetoin utilization protein acuB n=1 Tax=Flavobacterium hibernum TaxID=37752 RepID=A0A0D0EEW0_9FLAO|nr:CBS domain-containing protein [Flavobacterium hibernum]KIO53039.1 acetoin utilization protein acuB [Flavobacterium hibernum]OXA91324.1 acetoin utilization protein acuB [Flavobacterium hibernum]PTS96836.1 CBS domain-containing protein [Flavobacterium sp. HMWF030]STO15175.1 inosine 5'-monophosphate dehydrogenase [Flavobacterium hibernum]